MSTDISRRDLLGASAVALTGLATAGAFAGPQAAHADEAPANSDLASTFEGTVSWQAEYDVVVVGFGGAGANTAIAAADEGASVLLIDKAPEAEAGGNSAVCVQLLCSTDDPESMTTYIKAMRGNFETPSDAIIETYAQGMAENAGWITYLGGEPTVATKAATNDTAEWPELPGSQSFTILTVHQGRGDGAAYALFKSNVEQRENITVWYEAPATGLIQDPATGIVHGVEVSVDDQVVNVRAKNGVVLTLGGFENNSRYQQSFLRRAFWPSLGHAVYNTGDGIGLAISAGAELWHMASFESNNFEFCDEDLGCTWLWGNNIRGILIGENGKRFINEHELGGAKHGHLPYGGTWQAPALPEQSWQVMDSTIFNQGSVYSSWSPDGSFEIEKGWILVADTPEELGQQMGLSEEASAALATTIEEYNGFCEQGRDWAFERPDDLTPLAEPPYYAVKLTHCVVNTQGGAMKNERGEVIGVDGNPIPHLYEAGEFGDIWPERYQSACNLGGGMIFGRISGRNAAAAKDDNFQGSVMDGAENYVPQSVTNPPAEMTYEAGENEFIGRGSGKRGPVVVKVTKSGDGIEAVEVIEQHETQSIAAYALSHVPAAIVEANSVDVDIVAGATFTSTAILTAVTEALGE